MNRAILEHNSTKVQDGRFWNQEGRTVLNRQCTGVTCSESRVCGRRILRTVSFSALISMR